MRIGIPKEIKDQEYRVGLTPAGAASLRESGHEVLVERSAGTGSGLPDSEYSAAGARIVSAEEAWNADLVVKVKEPLETEYGYLRGQMLFTYLHLAGVAATLTEALLESKTTAVAYETLEDEHGGLPLLAPMSAVAGCMAPLMASYYLAKFSDGRGTLLGTALGQSYGKVVIVGDGVVGRHAARAVAALGSELYVFGRHEERAAELKRTISPRLDYVLSSETSLTEHAGDADVLIGAVLRKGARAPHVVTEAMVASMPRGAVIVDVSIDQGGCVETSRPTTHSDPVFVRHGVTHYCVTNMPGAYPRTSTFALTAATLPYVMRIANEGVLALSTDRGIARGVNTYQGRVSCRPVAEALGMMDRYRPFGSRG
jgi:alanine dehydrogenase